MLEERLAKAEAQLEVLQQDHEKLLLRQMAWQAENKLARIACPGLTPKTAVHMSLNRLCKGSDKNVDKTMVAQVVQQHPGLESGLEALKQLGTSIAHPVTARTGTGTGHQAVTCILLRELLDKEFTDGDPVKPDVEAVLACLTDLAQRLGEYLFLPTT